MHLIGTIFIGLLVGAVARLIMPGKQNMGWILTILLGVAGSFVATKIGELAGWYAEGQSAGFVMSVAGALLLLFLYGQYQKSQNQNAK
jgi:uncharacterized membrane protein YeaQ/YmgE (transglycosylase-associated protein family)